MTEKLRESSAPEKADEDQESLPSTIADRLTRVLSEMGQPLYWQDIHSLAETDGLGEINTKSTLNALVTMTLKGVMVRISRGVYSLPEFANETYQPRATFKRENRNNSWVCRTAVTRLGD